MTQPSLANLADEVNRYLELAVDKGEAYSFRFATVDGGLFAPIGLPSVLDKKVSAFIDSMGGADGIEASKEADGYHIKGEAQAIQKAFEDIKSLAACLNIQ